MFTRHRSSRDRLRFERLESRELLAATGFNTTPIASVTSSTGDTFEVGVDRLGRLVVASEELDLTGSVKLSVNDYEITNADNTVFTGSVETESSFVATPEAGPGRTRLPLTFAALLKVAAEEINRVEGGGFRVSTPKGGFDTLTLESTAFGGTPDAPASLTVSTGLLFKPFAQLISGGPTELVGQPVQFSIGVRDTLFESPIVDKNQPVELRIDFGDGTIVTRTVSQMIAPLDLSHTYAEAGDYTVTVTGTATAIGTTNEVAGTIALREVCRDVRVLSDVTVTDTPGDDDISLRNENGRLIAKVNGVDEDLGASEAIAKVEVQLGRGNNTLDASGLLPSQSLFVPAINNLDSETNTITGGPGHDTIFGGRGADIIFAGLGDDTITGNRGADEVHGEGGNDTIVIPGGFQFGAAFNTDLKEFLGGEGIDTLRIADIQDELQAIALQLTNEEFEAQLNLFKGIGSSAPALQIFIAELEALFIDPQSDRVNANFLDADYFERAEVHGSPENDRYNFTNAQLDVTAHLHGGDDDYLGGEQTDAVDGGAGDDDISTAGGDDVLSGGTGANDLDGGAGDDRYSLFFSETGEEPTFDEITDTSGDADALGLIGFVQGLALDLNTGVNQEIAPGVTLDLNLQTGRPIEDVAFQPIGDQPFSINGTNADNTFSVVPLDIEFGALGEAPVVTIGDGLGGNDLLTQDSDGLTRFNPFDFAPNAAFPGSEFTLPADAVVYNSAPNSGDVIDLDVGFRVTAGFPDAFRAVNVDLDLKGVDQVVDVNGNTIRFEDPARNFVGSGFDDTLQVDATLDSRRVEGGDGTDAVTVDAGGRPVTQTVDGAETTVQVAGYAPIVVTEFEAITIANAGPAGGFALDLSPGDDDALLTLQSIVGDGVTTVGKFSLTEATGGFAEQEFLHRDGVVEIRSAGGADTLTIDALGQPVEVVGADILIGDLPPIRLVGFTEVTIVDAGVPGDYNRDGRVDAADYTRWRDRLGANAGALPNDVDGGVIGHAQYDSWAANFGRTSVPRTFVLLAAVSAAPSHAVRPAANLDDARLLVPAQEADSRAETDRGVLYRPAVTPASIDAALLLLNDADWAEEGADSEVGVVERGGNEEPASQSPQSVFLSQVRDRT